MILDYLSVSQMQAFDHNVYGGCPTRWYHKRVLKFKEPESASMKAGSEAHSRLEHYLGTGENVLGPMEVPGMPFLPIPNRTGDTLRYSPLHLEWGFNDAPRSGHFYPPEQSLLWLEGVPFIGFIDVWALDPIAEVIDHKTTSSIADNAKTGSELAEVAQMVGCGEWLRVRYPHLDSIRLSHIYYQSKKPYRSEKRFFDVPVDVLEERWQYFAPVVREMKEVIAEPSLDKVPKNYEACHAWHRPCPHLSTCPRVFRPLNLTPSKGNNMGLLETLRNAGKIASTTPAPMLLAPAAEAQEPALPTPVVEAPKPVPVIPVGARIVVSKHIALAVGDTMDDGGKVIGDMTGGSYLVGPPSATPQPAQATATATEAPGTEKKKPGRPAKVKPLLDVIAAPVATPVTPSNTVEVFGKLADTAYLSSYVADLAGTIARAFDVKDIRLGSSDSMIGFGKWKGVLATAVRENPPKAGTYLSASGEELEDIVSATLAPIARKLGITLYVDCVPAESGVIRGRR